MKKVLLTLTLAAGVLAVVAGQVYAALPTLTYARQVFELGISTPANTVVLIGSGAGQLYSVMMSSGVVNDYCQFFDTNTISGIAIGTDGNLANSAPNIFNLVYSTGTGNTAANNQTAPPPALNVSGPVPGLSVPFANGLAGVCSVARRVQVQVGK